MYLERQLMSFDQSSAVMVSSRYYALEQAVGSTCFHKTWLE